MVPLVGKRLCYRVADAPLACLGHTVRTADGREYVECPNPVEKGRLCERCRAAENVAAASLHQAHRIGRGAVDARTAAHLEQPHRLYLAGFRDGSVKVGTTAGRSGGVRLAEQGAWVARYVALAADGFAVRELEDLVTEKLGIAQAVSVSRKVAGMVTPHRDEDLEADLTSRALDVGGLIDALGDTRFEFSSEAWRNPAASDPEWDDVVRYPLGLDSGSHDLMVRGVVGRVILAERPGSSESFVADLGPLFGIPIEFGSFEPDEVSVQGALF